MPFIGIIARISESNFIKNEIIKNSNDKFECLNINKQNIQNIKNIRFETIIINEDLEDFLNRSKYLEDILKNAKYLIINSDINKCENLDYNGAIITYGLNQKAMITISSVEKENILICVQENFKNVQGSLIEQQEFNVEITKNSHTKLCNSLAIFTTLIVYGRILKKI